MNTIDKLIEELCPDGVPFLPISDLSTTFSGGFIKKTKQDDDFEYPVYNGGVGPTGYYNEFNSPADSIAISGRGSIGFVNWVSSKFWAGNSCHVVKSNVSNLSNKYLYYYLKHNEQNLIALKNTGSIPALNLGPLISFQIAVPPIAVQNEIVKILDTFSQLGVQLESELQLRRKQLSFYCDLLFSADYLKDFKISNLGSVGVFIRGKGIQKTELLKSGIPAIHYGEIHTHYNSFTFDTKSYIDANNWSRTAHASHGDVILATTSESVEDVCKPVVWLGNRDIAVSGDATIYRHTLDPLFAAYFFQSNSFSMHKKRLANGSKVKRISGEKMKEVEILVPSPEAQKKIGEQLKLIEMLIIDTNFGIPAELFARQQQYMYYRDKLLTFKELESA
jgi:type I restriction enzyme S subunit